jgi:nicotinate-nucleotide--dimethylbenzimidazole phosphoribosyltransferase
MSGTDELGPGEFGEGSAAFPRGAHDGAGFGGHAFADEPSGRSAAPAQGPGGGARGQHDAAAANGAPWLSGGAVPYAEAVFGGNGGRPGGQGGGFAGGPQQYAPGQQAAPEQRGPGQDAGQVHQVPQQAQMPQQAQVQQQAQARPAMPGQQYAQQPPQAQQYGAPPANPPFDGRRAQPASPPQVVDGRFEAPTAEFSFGPVFGQTGPPSGNGTPAHGVPAANGPAAPQNIRPLPQQAVPHGLPGQANGQVPGQARPAAAQASGVWTAVPSMEHPSADPQQGLNGPAAPGGMPRPQDSAGGIQHSAGGMQPPQGVARAAAHAPVAEPAVSQGSAAQVAFAQASAVRTTAPRPAVPDEPMPGPQPLPSRAARPERPAAIHQAHQAAQVPAAHLGVGQQSAQADPQGLADDAADPSRESLAPPRRSAASAQAAALHAAEVAAASQQASAAPQVSAPQQAQPQQAQSQQAPLQQAPAPHQAPVQPVQPQQAPAPQQAPMQQQAPVQQQAPAAHQQSAAIQQAPETGQAPVAERPRPAVPLPGQRAASEAPPLARSGGFTALAGSPDSDSGADEADELIVPWHAASTPAAPPQAPAQQQAPEERPSPDPVAAPEKRSAAPAAAEAAPVNAPQEAVAGPVEFAQNQQAAQPAPAPAAPVAEAAPQPAPAPKSSVFARAQPAAAQGEPVGKGNGSDNAGVGPGATANGVAPAGANGSAGPGRRAAAASKAAEPTVAEPPAPAEQPAQSQPAQNQPAQSQSAQSQSTQSQSAQAAGSPRPGGRRRAAEPAAPQPQRRPDGRAPGYEDDALSAVYRVIHDRRDVRNDFLADDVPVEVLTRILEAAHTAPSVGFSQPWDFLVLRDKGVRQAVHDLAMRQRQAYSESLPKARAQAFTALKVEAILETPLNIVVTCDPTRGGRHTLGRYTQPSMAPFSSVLAVENLWLAARAEGLGVGWVSFFDERELSAVLGLPPHLQIVAYLCIGYVRQFPMEPELSGAGWAKRRPLAWAVHEERFGYRALPGAEPVSLLGETIAAIRGLDPDAVLAARERQARMTKPPGSLGTLEAVAEQLAGLAGVCPPPMPEPAALAVFAGDHGVHAQGVTPWPQEVTAQMVANFLNGGAVVNAFAKQVGAEVCVVDVGVNAQLEPRPGMVPRKIRFGTADMTQGPAMSRAEAVAALEAGIETARDLVTAGNKCVLTGDMGITNTTASAALIAAFTGASPAQVTGYGTGIDEQTYAHKVEVVRTALQLHQPDPQDPVGVLAAFGGLEHAALAGFILAAAALRVPVILDGVIAGAAALVAQAFCPEVTAACVAGHRSAEPGHGLALDALGVTPLIDLELRLGEGSGAALALPLVASAVRALREVATFDDAGVADASDAAVARPIERERA